MNLITKEKNFMNTTITFKVVSKSTVKSLDAIEEAFGEFDRIVKQYTRFNESSELSNLNRNSGKWVKVTDEFFWLIEYMLNMSEKTHGAFDPTIIDFLEVYGYDKNYDFSKLDNPELDTLVKKIAKERKSWKEIEMNKKTNEVKLAEGQRIDLGGVGKGYAIDCAFEKLKKASDNFLIDAGGDFRATGVNEKGEVWKVGMKDKRFEVEELIGYIELDNQALACSGSWSRKVKQFHHLINPTTGKPQNKFRTVFVQAPDGITSDSWATALFVSGGLNIKIPKILKIYKIEN